jgi:DNA-binding transcriptional LysR family regulator
MMDWDKLRVFHIVAQTKNITRAAEELQMNQSSVSRQIAALEAQAHAPLFHRRPRGLVLTEHGQMLHATVSEFFRNLSATENALLELEDTPKGDLRVTLPVAIGTVWFVPMLREFMQAHKEIRLTLIVEDREEDLSNREVDAAIRFYPSRQPDLIQRQIFTLRSGVYASNDYLSKKGTPRTLEDLRQHTLISYTEDRHPPFQDVNWLYRMAARRGVALLPHLGINSLYGMLRAVEHGIGIAPLPDYMLDRSRRVSRILEHLEGPVLEGYFVYPADRKNSKRIRAFYNFLHRKIAERGLV